jgi:aminopeptidase N
VAQVVVGDPGILFLFSDPVSLRGAMTLQALRGQVGDRDFFRILRAWAARKAGGNGTAGQFIALAERISGQQLDALFTTWLFTPAKPPPAEAATAAATASAARGQATLATGCRCVRGGCATGRR